MDSGHVCCGEPRAEQTSAVKACAAHEWVRANGRILLLNKAYNLVRVARRRQPLVHGASRTAGTHI